MIIGCVCLCALCKLADTSHQSIFLLTDLKVVIIEDLVHVGDFSGEIQDLSSIFILLEQVKNLFVTFALKLVHRGFLLHHQACLWILPDADKLFKCVITIRYFPTSIRLLNFFSLLCIFLASIYTICIYGFFEDALGIIGLALELHLSASSCILEIYVGAILPSAWPSREHSS